MASYTKLWELILKKFPSKSCSLNGHVGSNPTSSAKREKSRRKVWFFILGDSYEPCADSCKCRAKPLHALFHLLIQLNIRFIQPFGLAIQLIFIGKKLLNLGLCIVKL